MQKFDAVPLECYTEIPHLAEVVSLDGLTTDSFRQTYPHIELVPNKIVATCGLGAIRLQYRDIPNYKGEPTSAIFTDFGMITNARTEAVPTTATDTKGGFESIYIFPSPQTIIECFGRVGLPDSYRPVYCPIEDPENHNIIPVVQHTEHLKRDEYAMATGSLASHDSQLAGHVFGMSLLDAPARQELVDGELLVAKKISRAFDFTTDILGTVLHPFIKGRNGYCPKPVNNQSVFYRVLDIFTNSERPYAVQIAALFTSEHIDEDDLELRNRTFVELTQLREGGTPQAILPQTAAIVDLGHRISDRAMKYVEFDRKAA